MSTLQDNTSFTKIEEIGEFGLIKRLTAAIQLQNKSTVKGIGDDAAVIEYINKVTVVSTDMLIEGVHFDIMYMALKHLGYKAVITNLSDIYAMNAQPRQITVAMGISSKFTVEAIEEIYTGMLLACKKYGVDMVGGDTTSSLSGLVISITVIGEAEKEELVYRNTAEETNLLCVSGDLGAAYVGLQLLEREKQIFKENPHIQPDLEGNDYIIERQLKPEARKEVLEELKRLKILPTAMIDISDGLASEILHICHSSDKGCMLYEDKIPIDPATFNKALEFNLDPTLCALSGGEDYELLFTIKMADYEKIKGNTRITVIGHITDKNAGTHLISKSGTQHPLTAQGWDSFFNNNFNNKTKH